MTVVILCDYSGILRAEKSSEMIFFVPWQRCNCIIGSDVCNWKSLCRCVPGVIRVYEFLGAYILSRLLVVGTCAAAHDHPAPGTPLSGEN